MIDVSCKSKYHVYLSFTHDEKSFSGEMQFCSSPHECSTTYVNSGYQRCLQAARHIDGKAQQRRVPEDTASLSLRNKDSVVNTTWLLGCVKTIAALRANLEMCAS